MQWPWIRLPIEMHLRARHSGIGVVGNDRERAIQHVRHFRVATQSFVAQRDLLKGCEIARVELQCALKVPQTFLLLSLATVYISRQLEHARIIRQGAARDGEFGERAIEFEIALIKMLRLRQVRLAAIRA